jgi:hypothetical protein
MGEILIILFGGFGMPSKSWNYDLTEKKKTNLVKKFKKNRRYL